MIDKLFDTHECYDINNEYGLYRNCISKVQIGNYPIGTYFNQFRRQKAEGRRQGAEGTHA